MSQMNPNSGDMCITNNKLHFQRDGVHIDPVAMSIVSPVRSVLYSVSAELPNKVENESQCSYALSTWKDTISEHK